MLVNRRHNANGMKSCGNIRFNTVPKWNVKSLSKHTEYNWKWNALIRIYGKAFELCECFDFVKKAKQISFIPKLYKVPFQLLCTLWWRLPVNMTFHHLSKILSIPSGSIYSKFIKFATHSNTQDKSSTNAHCSYLKLNFPHFPHTQILHRDRDSTQPAIILHLVFTEDFIEDNDAQRFIGVIVDFMTSPPPTGCCVPLAK